MMSPDSDSDFEVYTSPFSLSESIEDETNVQNENSIIDKFVRTVTVDDFRSSRPERTYWYFAVSVLQFAISVLDLRVWL